MMNITWPPSNTYIVAVSGGVDSVVLLDMLVQQGGYKLIVAHVDHGIREDSAQDADFVRGLAAQYQLDFEHTKYNYSLDTPEEVLRRARYDFLFKTMQKHQAAGIITAHHADDVLETSIMNIRRGTDRYGAAGGMTRHGIIRPLLGTRKKELVDYAQQHNLTWREDSTNQDIKYTRNKIRHEVVPHIDVSAYLRHLHELGGLNKKIDSELAGLVLISKGHITIPGSVIQQLSLREVEVLLAYALRQIQPNIELNQRRIAEAARQIMLGTDKISFSTGAQDAIIIDIP